MSMNRRQFAIQSVILLAGGAMLTKIPSALAGVPVPKETRNYGFKLRPGEWLNWTHNVHIKNTPIVKPTSTAELQRIVAESPAIRAVGSGHSISTIAFTEDVLMNTDALNEVIHIDHERMHVTVQGGMKLRDFNDLVTRNGLCIPSTGDTTYQSLAGLLSTATHGTGMKWGSCSDEESLVGMELVRPDGSLVSLSQDRPADHDLLRAARVSLGSFGIIHSVTIHVDKVHNLEHVAKKGDLSDAFDPKHLAHDHYEFAYFPFTDKVFQFFRNKTDKKVDVTKLENWFNEVFIENDLAKLIMQASALRPSILPRVMNTFVNSIPEQHEVDRADLIMTTPRKTPAFLMEFALPINNGPAAMEAFRKCVHDFSKKTGKDRYFVNLPTQIRFVRADHGTLISPAEGRETCWFGLGHHVAHKGFIPFFQAFEKELIKLEGRPHWGKMFFTNPTEQYPKWNEWVYQQKQFDPKGKFRSPYLSRLLKGQNAQSGNIF